MEKKKVGVIISCYNHVNYVEQAINSVLYQTYQDFEVYAADDASSDGTREKLLQFDDKLKEIHLFDVNEGGQAIFLLGRVENKYTALLSSDDFWYEDKLEKQVRYLDENPDCAACFTWCKQINNQGEKINVTVPFNQKNRKPEEWMRYFYQSGNCLVHPSILIRTDIYRRLVDKHNRAFRQIPDFHMWVELVQKKKIHIIEEELMSFRWHSSESTMNVSALTFENDARHLNEECYMWYETIANMDNEYFKRAFQDMLINPSAQQPQELMCEKFFVLSRARLELIRQAAVFYFYDIYKDKMVRDCFLNKYGFSNLDFYQLETQIGSAKLYLDSEEKKQIMREMGQCIIDANR
jgi:glycosyltransferase involved in cell wall biosynthesis